MKYDLIFYISKKTSYCEKAVRRSLAQIGGEIHRVVGAISPTMLGEEVSRSLRVCPMAVIVGGLSSDEDDNLATVLSRVFSNSALTLENMRRLTAASGSSGYIVRCRNQILLALPDSPGDIEEMFSEELLAFISEKLTPEKNDQKQTSALTDAP